MTLDAGEAITVIYDKNIDEYYIISAFYIWGLSAIIIGLPIVIISIIIYVSNN